MEAINKARGEVRRIHIIYFLSRMGRNEHPHLIQVYPLNRNGVYLRDIKRWLADLRGKDMAEAFAWSYKRRYKNGYKNGYVWQDLLDDDLITPISDNEYVLKGSQISIPAQLDSKRNSIPSRDEVNGSQLQEKKTTLDTKVGDTLSLTPNEESYEEMPLFGSNVSTTTTEDSVKHHKCLVEKVDEKIEGQSSSSLYATILNKKTKKKSSQQINITRKSNSPNSSFSSESTFMKSKSYASVPSAMFRNLISCGGVDTNDSAFVAINRKSKTSSDESAKNNSSSRIRNQQKPKSCSRKSFEPKKQEEEEETNGFSRSKSKGVSAAYKPLGGPTCSQCGKIFKPEKMYTHMKSCRGMKAFAKSSKVSIEKKTLVPRSADSSFEEEPNRIYFLTN